MQRNIPQQVLKIAKRVINLKYISLVNLILDKEAVTELIQRDFNTKKLGQELAKIVDPKQRDILFADYYELETKLGGKGASENAAHLIFEAINGSQVVFYNVDKIKSYNA